jgi:RNA polymerase sigma factor (sigma-70 family)
MSELRVLICDDNQMMREALALYLVAQPSVATADTASNLDDAIRSARRGYDVMVLDLGLGADPTGLVALEALEALQNLGIATPVLLLGSQQDLDLIARGLSLGALGYCPKTVSPSDLYRAIGEVASGRASIPDEVLEPLLHRLLDETKAAAASTAVLATLTAREREVLRSLAQGTSRQEIARRLGLSANTVRTHLRHVMEKLGVTSQLAAAARGRELLEASGAMPDEPVAKVIDLLEWDPRLS